MKKEILFLLFILNLNLFGQTHEIGGGIGFAYYFGDLYLNQIGFRNFVKLEVFENYQ